MGYDPTVLTLATSRFNQLSYTYIFGFNPSIKSSELWDSNPLSFTWIKTNHVNQRLMFEQTFGLEPKSHDYKSRILPIELWMHYFLSENRESNPKN